MNASFSGDKERGGVLESVLGWLRDSEWNHEIMILVGLQLGFSFKMRSVMVLRRRPSAARRIVGFEKAISD